jgi:Tfp pilus assembly protein FimV
VKNSTKFNLPALFVVGGGLATTLATAIELGEINVESSLGQPLRASIAYTLAPNEHVFAYCVSLKPGFAANGLPVVTQADVSIANGVISLTGNTPIREPLMTARLDIACPYTAKLSREYMLFIDPVQAVRSAQAQPSQAERSRLLAQPAQAERSRLLAQPAQAEPSQRFIVENCTESRESNNQPVECRCTAFRRESPCI